MNSIKSARNWNGWILPGIFILAACLRLISLDADPPSTVGLHFISDEGWWVHNARNKILFNEWILDEFNQSLLASPTFCMATYGVYSLFGVNYGSSRIVPVLSGLLTLLLFTGILYAHSPPATVTLAMLLFGCNFAFTTMNRTAYVDSTALMFLVLSWWLLEKLPRQSLGCFSIRDEFCTRRDHQILYPVSVTCDLNNCGCSYLVIKKNRISTESRSELSVVHRRSFLGLHALEKIPVYSIFSRISDHVLSLAGW